MIRINQIKLHIDEDNSLQALKGIVCKKLRIDSVDDIMISRLSIDARRKPEIYKVYTIDVQVNNEEAVLRKSRCKQAMIYKPVSYKWPQGQVGEYRPVIIGMGPAGLFCAYMLAEAGCKPIICDRGRDITKRTEDVLNFWNKGVLDPVSNVQFGEGGAGTFSDGKLNTLVNDKSGRNAKVLNIFVKHGAPENILYDSKPHIGTDVLRDVIASMRDYMISLGCEFKYERKLTTIDVKSGITEAVFEDGSRIATDSLVLAIGHSARDTFAELYRLGVPMSAKSFAVGLRVIHPQSMIDNAMYGADAHKLGLGSAPYKLTHQCDNGRGVYSFCMCPGGYVVNASSTVGYTAVNGMSYSGRDSGYANSGIIVTVTPDDYPGDDTLAGVKFQEKLEAECYRLGEGNIPVQTYGSYKSGHKDTEPVVCDGLKGRINTADLSHLLPEELRESFKEGMEAFDNIIPGFASDDTVLAGIESRTSSPVRIHRNEDGMSEYGGIYPCGEGAGYAGGIMSAAMDGIYIAEEIWKKHLTV